MTPHTPAAVGPLGLFEAHNDVGTPTLAGSAGYDASTGVYTMTGAGVKIGDAHDEFQFLWTRVAGDFIMEAHVSLAGLCNEARRSAGCMARSTADHDSAYADAAIHADGLTALQFRRATGGLTEQVIAAVIGADTIRFERRGNTYRFKAARPDEAFVEAVAGDLALGDAIYVGLFVCSHHATTLEQATFRNVSLQHRPT